MHDSNTMPSPAGDNMNHRNVFACALLLPALLLGEGLRSEVETGRTSLISPCSSEEYRQFDFWIGNWVVTDSSGATTGTSQITEAANGCAIQEHWTGESGNTGVSLNFFDERDGRWHQHWVGGGGLILHLSGSIQDGAMVLEGRRQTPQGELIDRITWSQLESGEVRQEWINSSDGGRNWTKAFVGFYQRR